jgi:DNA-binding MarR family transcriptional regulator
VENKKLFGLICCLQRELSRQNDVHLAEYGITGVQLHSLIFLLRSQDRGISVCQRDIERELGLRPSSVSTLLANLERKDLIVKSQNAGDARTKYISLTDKALKLCAENKKLMDSNDAFVQSILSDEEQEQLKVLLEKVLHSLQSNKQ